MARSSVVRLEQLLPSQCLICGCRLDGENRSEILNVCCSCQHSLES